MTKEVIIDGQKYVPERCLDCERKLSGTICSNPTCYRYREAEKMTPKKKEWKEREIYALHKGGISPITHAVYYQCFSKEEAEQEVKKLRAIETVKKYIHDTFGVFEPDWDMPNEKKYFITYNHQWSFFDDDVHLTDIDRTRKPCSPFGYLKSEEDAEQLIKDCEKELKIIWEVE